MKVFFALLLVPAAVAAALFFLGTSDDDAAAITARYGSCPKGVILEGEAAGIEAIKTIKYHIDQNEFVLNQEVRYAVPVSREILYQVVMALARDNRLGVSLTSTEKEISYGALDPKSETVKQLLAADKLLTGAVLGNAEYLRGVRLPADFSPQSPEKRRFPAICVHKFFDFGFTRRQNQYFRVKLKMANLLFPMAAKQAVDGGFLADELHSENLEPTDQDNLRNLREHSEDFLKIPEVKRAANIGETAAFIRYLRDRGNLDLVALGRHIMRK